MASKKKSSPEPQDDSVYRVKHISRSAWEDGTQGLPGLPSAERAGAGRVPPPRPQPDTLLEDVAADLAMTGEIPLELIREVLRKKEQEAERQENKKQEAKGKKQEPEGKRQEPLGRGPIRPEEIVSLPGAPPEPAPPKKPQAEKPKREKRPKAPPAQAETAREPAPPEDEIEAARELMLRMKAKSRFPEAPAPEAEKPETVEPTAIEKKHAHSEPKPERVKKSKPPKREKEAPEASALQEQPAQPKQSAQPDPEKETPKAAAAPQVPPEAAATPQAPPKMAAVPQAQDKTNAFRWLLNTIRLFFIAEDEQKEEDLWDEDVPLYHIPVRALLVAAYRNTYYLGLRFMRPIAAFWRFSLPYARYPLLALWHLVRAVALTLRHFTIGQAQKAFQSGRMAHARRIAGRKAEAAPARPLLRAARELAEDYRPVLRPAGNALMPIAALVVLLLVIQTWGSQVYALEVTVDGIPVGTVANEGVLLAAQEAANQQMGLVEESSAVSEEGIRDYAQYSLVRVAPEALTSADLLCDQLLQNSPSRMVNACAVFIADEGGKGRFLAAVTRNSTDAMSVLESVKKDKTDTMNLKVDPAKGDTVGFVQEIELRSGSYPEDLLLDVQDLMQLLGGKVKGSRYHTLGEGDTISGIATLEQTTQENLLRMNPWLRGKETSLHPGDQILVEEQVDFLQVKVVRTETRLEDVRYEIADTYNSRLWSGEIVIRTKGVPGADEVVERVTYINGVRHGKPEEISRRRVKDPVTERRDVGNRNRQPGTSTPIIINVSGGFVWPVVGCTRISSGYGYRGKSFHKGIDIADGNTNGKVVVASRDGVVEMAQYYSSYGNMILINHGGGVKTRYAHLMSGSMSVSPGQHVSAGQPIGRVGSTGNSTGPHLHFEVIINGSPQNPLNYVSR